MQEMSIGEFARRSRLSPRALRLYDGLGLLSPGTVDELSGYRYYERGQLEQAELIVTLRHIGVPLATVREWLALDPAELGRAGDHVLARGRVPARRSAPARQRPR